MSKCSLGDRVICHIKENYIITAYEVYYEISHIFEVVGFYESDSILYVPQDMFLKNTKKIDHYSYKNYGLDKKFIDSSVSIVSDYQIVSIYQHMDGMCCAKCNEFYYMAEPNQENGTLICYLCRFNPYR